MPFLHFRSITMCVCLAVYIAVWYRHSLSLRQHGAIWQSILWQILHGVFKTLGQVFADFPISRHFYFWTKIFMIIFEKYSHEMWHDYITQTSVQFLSSLFTELGLFPSCSTPAASTYGFGKAPPSCVLFSLLICDSPLSLQLRSVSPIKFNFCPSEGYMRMLTLNHHLFNTSSILVIKLSCLFWHFSFHEAKMGSFIWLASSEQLYRPDLLPVTFHLPFGWWNVSDGWICFLSQWLGLSLLLSIL